MSETKEKLTIPQKKEKILEYYRALPILKEAGHFAGVTDDTVTNWKKADPIFSEAIAKAKSDWFATKAGKVKDPGWLLERLGKEYFSTRTELTGADGERLMPKPILGGTSVPTDSGRSEDTETPQAD